MSPVREPATSDWIRQAPPVSHLDHTNYWSAPSPLGAGASPLTTQPAPQAFGPDWLATAQWRAPKRPTAVPISGPDGWIYPTGWEHVPLPEGPPKPWNERVRDAVNRFGNAVEYYAIFPELRPKLRAVGEVLKMLLPGTGTADSMASGTAAGDAYREGRYGASAGHLGSGMVDAASDVFPGLKGVAAPVKAILGGVMARTFPHANLKVAEGMAREGRSADDIWRATGLERGADRKWRFEISDVNYRVRPNVGSLDSEGFRVAPLFAHHRHPDLQQAYPHLTGITSRIKIDPYLPTGGEYDAATKTLTIIARSPEHAREIGIHELMHPIQVYEQFARGGSRWEFWREGDLMKEAYTKYLALAGEVEGRNMTTRLRMSEQERRARPPSSTEDSMFPRDKQIIRYHDE